LLIVEFYGSSVSGYEFSPDDFSAREFSYRRSPFTQTLRSDRYNQPYSFECSAMTAKGHIKVVTSTPKRWDLFRETNSIDDPLSKDFDARFLTHFLDYGAQQWTVSYPKKATLLWPEIAKLARAGLYLHIPPIMLSAIGDHYTDFSDRSPAQFKLEIGPQLAQAYRTAARIAEINDDGNQLRWLAEAERLDRWTDQPTDSGSDNGP
jgi:hypothetical protein